MLETKFSRWLPWTERGRHDGISHPGVYIIAVPKRPLTEAPFGWRSDIVYVGMTNSVGGLASRLRQFANTLKGRRGHGGADRVRYRFRQSGVFERRAFVAIAAFNCDPRSNDPRTFKIMGNVARLEYLCLAEYVRRFGELPEFNDKKSSPKFSLTVGRK